MMLIFVEFLDTVIFLWLAIKGLLFIASGSGGYIIFWGCALVCTAVYWKKLEKKQVVTSVENVLKVFSGRKQ